MHKAGTPLRPVVAAFDGPLSGISILLERILHQLLTFVPAHIENTQAALTALKEGFPGGKVPKGTSTVSMDVVALYPSIPIDDGVAAVLKKITEHEEEIDLLGLSKEDIQRLLKLVLENNYFKFDNEVFRQRKGVAMGNHLAPPFAILFMDKLEQDMLRTAERQPCLYKRYVDDCLMGWTHGEQQLRQFIDHCNSQHLNIRFTWDSTSGGVAVPFMDASIAISADHTIHHELFQKPSDSGVNLNFTTALPMGVKMSIATQQFRRAAFLSSDSAAEIRSSAKITTLLQENDYSQEAIEKAYKSSKKPPRGRGRGDDRTIPLKLPFISDTLHSQVSRLSKQSGLPIRVIYQPARNLKSHLVRSAFIPPTCSVHQKFEEQQMREKRTRGKPRDDCISCQSGLKGSTCDRRGVVYLLICKLCNEEYIGETARTPRARLGEHHFQARNKIKQTAWGEHMREKHPEVDINKEPVFTAKILATVEMETKRKIREAIEIRERNPAINRSKGWLV